MNMLKKYSSWSFYLLVIILVSLSVWSDGMDNQTDQITENPEPNPNLWVSAYLATWQHDAGTPYSNWGALTEKDIDWDTITHLIYFALPIDKSGRIGSSLDPAKRRNLNTDRLQSIVPAAHKNDTKILFSVGGSGSYESFSSAIKFENRRQFINTIADFIKKYGFDGVDLDMEPIREKDFNNYRQFVSELHAEFSNMRTRNGEVPMITIAALKGRKVSQLYARVQQYVDQINIMTYDMAQAWEGWQAWHNSALYSDGVTFDKTGEEMSNINQKVEIALSEGIDRQKLGIGIDFYGYIWHSVHYLGKWESWPEEDLSIMERSGGVPYYELHNRFDLDRARWDSSAQAPYLNVEDPKAFVTFDNERSVRRKIRYAVEKGLGGVILWELGGGYLKDQQVQPKDPLLQAVKSELQKFKNLSSNKE